MTLPRYSSMVFNDIDHFRQWAAEAGWELESTQVSRGPNEIKLDHLSCPEFSVAHHRVKRSIYDVYEIPSRHVVFAICREKLPAVWCGREFGPALLGIQRPRRTHWARLPDGWETYEFTVSEEMIARTELFPPDFFEKTTRLEQAFLPLVEPQTGLLLRSMDGLFRTIRAADGVMAGTISATEISNSVLHSLLQLFDAGLRAGPGGLPRPVRRPDLVEQGRDFMIANLQMDLTADEMAQSLGVSYRVLNFAFQDAVGVSPYQYLLTEKLHAVRRKLKASDVSITEACLSYGFSTPSRFARQYQRLFGELPSETRKKTARRR